MAFVFLNKMKNKINTLVWQFSLPQKSGNTEGVAQTHYLIGTIHAKDNRVFQLMDKYCDIIQSCDIFATELPLDDTHDIDIQQHIMLPEGLVLRELLSRKMYEKTAAFLRKRLGVDIVHFDHFLPLFLTNLLTENVLNSENQLSLDGTLWQFAKENGKILRGIETIAEQLNVLKEMTLADQIKGLKDIVRHHATFRKQLQNMIKRYEKQDISALYHAAKKTAKSSRKIMIYDRNELMTERIIALSREGKLCVAVGAGHLAGKKGVLNLLKKSGCIVKPF